MKLEVESNECARNFPINTSSMFLFSRGIARSFVVSASPCVRFWRGASWINYNLLTTARGPSPYVQVLIDACGSSGFAALNYAILRTRAWVVNTLSRFRIPSSISRVPHSVMQFECMCIHTSRKNYILHALHRIL